METLSDCFSVSQCLGRQAGYGQHTEELSKLREDLKRMPVRGMVRMGACT